MTPSSSSYDVVVLGAGPAGATTAAFLAEAGYRTLMVDSADGPRFKVGESLMPATYWTLERLGLLERMKASGFVRKHSVQFYSPKGKASAPFYFSTTDPAESSSTWQVLRRDFDAMVIDAAVERGAEVVWNTMAREVLFDGDRAVGVQVDAADGETVELGARLIVDATGQRALLARQLRLLEIDPCLRHASIYTHYEGAERACGVDEGATVIYHTSEGRSWFWYIPLPENRVSVGVVGSVDYLIRGRQGDPERVFDEELAKCPALAPRLAPGRRVRDMRVARDFSYHATKIAGDGWVLVGDAYGFIDPIYSTGVFLALTSGEMAADAAIAALAEDDVSAERLGAFADRYVPAITALKQLVYAFYDPSFSFARFLDRYPQHRLDIVHVLMGNMFRHPTEGLFRSLEQFQRSTQPAVSQPEA